MSNLRCPVCNSVSLTPYVLLEFAKEFLEHFLALFEALVERSHDVEISDRILVYVATVLREHLAQETRVGCHPVTASVLLHELIHLVVLMGSKVGQAYADVLFLRAERLQTRLHPFDLGVERLGGVADLVDLDM